MFKIDPNQVDLFGLDYDFFWIDSTVIHVYYHK